MNYNYPYPQQGVIGMPIPKVNNQQYNGQYPGNYPVPGQVQNMMGQNMVGQNFIGNPNNIQQLPQQQQQPQQLGAPYYQQE